MQQLIEEWDATHRHLLHGAPMESLDIVEILAPLRGRDVICVGKTTGNMPSGCDRCLSSSNMSVDVQVENFITVVLTIVIIKLNLTSLVSIV